MSRDTNNGALHAFRDFIVWPASSRGIPLTFRITVVVGKTKRIVNYAVTPRG